ncbi:accessory Sec system glycosyltransferase GtfA [Streptococcus uberis]|uniref:accessory Sec system glycosyltransferase GtfA n=1 Tax=Streptococcus uberis TaxID=1349 RepID=UPI001FF21FA7|nr:accessory Sec system glycosyltransferase GtfA [Streptococcus uberis]MCK1166094.1 accessory Sec system glycosyltransferase GtfA [Streptococcus uberis]MCK1191935.1 accessory Sec system glycosyltransferase GtfA [Streptococcus uberis]MCK1204644.1 accessory Sec system glycosyltransferase GtfA [Streptococcus uberis]MCK1209977.1 accessory Sec system glycosyltransferase GtfA [Streptococcus uberis]MCK1232342.1 accessory Sec system glycosyltransferase GtfA [Streptococcus uberis]
MTLYNINMGIGWASSGVEYAQIYRAKLLRMVGEKGKFIFTDLILNENIEHLTKNIGFEDDEVIWMYHYFTDIKLAPTSYTIEDLLATIPFDIEKEEKNGKVRRFFYDQNKQFVTCYLTDPTKNLVDRAEFVSNGCLIRKDYFNYTRYCSEYFTPKDNKAHLYQRRYFNEDGSTAFDEILDGEDPIYRFEDQIFQSRRELLAYFIRCLELTENDIVILDRSSEIGQAVFEEKGKAKIGSVVHAEHYSKNATDDDYILWNNYYEYEFIHADQVDFFICSTEAQTNTLSQQFQKYQGYCPRILTIPVGSLQKLRRPKGLRQAYSLMTASRLANEKHIDWLVLAVVEAKKALPDLTFDIYGKGGEEQKLKNLIQKHQADSYIHLKGHADLTEIYENYDAYLAGSTSEGFGLTLMEAVGSGLPIIGFDVPYGNITFVDHQKNGFLIPKEESDQVDVIVKQLSQAIIDMYQKYDIEAWQNHSYQKAEKFLSSEVALMWKDFLKEFKNA